MKLGPCRVGIAEDQLVVRDVLLSRVGEKVKALRIEWRRRGERRRGDDTVGQQSRARECVRTAA